MALRELVAGVHVREAVKIATVHPVESTVLLLLANVDTVHLLHRVLAALARAGRRG